ncbi:hypothetical protein U9M48_007516 [Paspalum notatum var. saurae]|uniref:Uncharacterized protein n=1 Tax=Paspalum notatum var. saurae TaxID=547442 RepID=A0AAQ3PUH9_PASNO
MAKQSCCYKKKLRRGLWSPEEDEKLMNHIAKYGHGCWSSVPKLAGLERCGKSCRLRWINYLRPDLKRGTFSQEEEDLIIHLHSLLGNKWSQIAAQLPGRTDNEVKNFWNSYVKKRLRERGIDPATHQPLADPGNGSGAAACRAAVFGDVDFIPTTTTLQAPQQLADPNHPMLVDWPVAGGGGAVPPPPSMSRPSCYQQGCCLFDMDALQPHCGAIPPAPVGVPSASSSSTLTTSMADAEHCNTTTSVAGAGLPWLELGPNAAGHVDSYAGALDELRWSEYFEGALQAGQCVYSGKDDVTPPPHFDVHGLSNWC